MWDERKSPRKLCPHSHVSFLVFVPPNESCPPPRPMPAVSDHLLDPRDPNINANYGRKALAQFWQLSVRIRLNDDEKHRLDKEVILDAAKEQALVTIKALAL